MGKVCLSMEVSSRPGWARAQPSRRKRCDARGERARRPRRSAAHRLRHPAKPEPIPGARRPRSSASPCTAALGAVRDIMELVLAEGSQPGESSRRNNPQPSRRGALARKAYPSHSGEARIREGSAARSAEGARTDAGGQRESYTYAADLMLRTETRPNAVQIVRTPDSAGRLDTVAFPGGLMDYDYHAAGVSGGGRVSDIFGPYGVNLHFTYDGRLTTSTTWSGDVIGSVGWQYNNDFQKILETVTGATGTGTTRFGYDQDMLLTCASPTSCTPPSADALVLTRHPQHGMVTNIVLGQTSEAWTYNNFGEFARQTATFAGSPLVDITYHGAGAASRDALGRIVEKSETIGGETNVFRYTYDALRRLTSVTKNGVLEEEFTYDANGNRLTAFRAGVGTVAATYDDQDRLLTYGTWVFTYTANGEMETKTNTATGEEWIFGYDAMGNLVSAGLPNGDLVEYLVDGMGRRVGKMKNGVLLKQWIYRDALKPVAELDGSGALVSQFAYASRSNVPDYVLRGGQGYRVVSDHLGSPKHVVNVADSGDVPVSASYTSFGEPSGTGLEWMPFGFAGGIYDADTGLVRFGARDYDPVAGRWTAKDPIRWRPQQANLYGYVIDDPVNKADPFGLWGIDVPCPPGASYGTRVQDCMDWCGSQPSGLGGDTTALCGLQCIIFILITECVPEKPLPPPPPTECGPQPPPSCDPNFQSCP